MFTLDKTIKFFRSQHLPENQDKFDERQEKKYDGFNGVLPQWMTDEDKARFLQAREQIIFYGYEDKLSWIIDKINIHYNFLKFGEYPKDYLRLVERDVVEIHFETLGFLKYRSEQQSEEILENQIGKGASNIIHRIRSILGGKGKAGKVGALKRTIIALDIKDFNDFLNKFDNTQLIEQHYHDKKINIHNIVINAEKEILENYTVRAGTLPGKKPPVSFARIRTIISEINKLNSS